MTKTEDDKQKSPTPLKSDVAAKPSPANDDNADKVTAAPAQPRLVGITLDQATILYRNADVEQERRIAIFDLLEKNHFAPRNTYAGGYNGPYKLHLSVVEGRLLFDIARADGLALEQITLAMTPFRRIIREYLYVCESYFSAIKCASASQIEAIDMGRRGLHNEGSTTLRNTLDGKIAVDFDTARRLFTLICVLHLR